MKKASELTDDELRILIAEDQEYIRNEISDCWQKEGKCYFIEQTHLLQQLPNYPADLNAMHEARAVFRDDLETRVKFLRALNRTIAPRCPVNKVGTPLVSDWTMIDSSAREQAEAYVIARELAKL